MKKRIAALLCAAMMAVTLAACTSEGPGKEASEPAADSGQAKTEEGKVSGRNHTWSFIRTECAPLLRSNAKGD